jgi:photosystem II stability/assembly factor-like uncharacterized protein
MNKNISCLLLMFLSLMIMSCSDNSTPAAPVTGWAIGWSEDAGNFSVKILKTDNGGAAWTLQALPAGCEGFQGNDISAVNQRVAWAAMSLNKGASIDGGILHTADGGASWTIQTLPDGMTNRQIKNIKGVSPTEAWAVSIGGDVLHTIDGGVSWNIVEVKDVDGHIITMTQVNRMDVTGQDIWIVDVNSFDMGVIHSPDGGLTWRREQLPDVLHNHGPLAISAFSSLIAWAAVNSEGYLWWTANGGLSWNKSKDTISGTADFDDICASSANVIWIAQNNGLSSGGVAARITVSDGVFSSNLYTDINYMMEGVAPMNDNIAWLVGFKTLRADPSLPKGVIYFTNDGGLNWQLQAMPANALDVNLWKVSFVGARR